MIPADSHSTDPQKLVSALDCELTTLVQVLDMLDIEHEALLGSDPERLEQAVVAKQNAIGLVFDDANVEEAPKIDFDADTRLYE